MPCSSRSTATPSNRLVLGLVVALLALVFAESAYACVCVEATVEERLEQADAAVVGRVVREEVRELRGAHQRLLTVEVDQRVKGDVAKTLVVRSPEGSSCDLDVAHGKTTGLFLTRAPDGGWLGTTCSLVAPGPLVVAGGEPRGGVIKVVIGVLILGLVLSWALRRKTRGARPHLPGAPEP